MLQALPSWCHACQCACVAPQRDVCDAGLTRRSTVSRPSIAARPSFSGSPGGAQRDGVDAELRKHLALTNYNDINNDSNNNNHPHISHLLVSNQHSRFAADSLQAFPLSSTALTSLANWAQGSRHVCGGSPVLAPTSLNHHNSRVGLHPPPPPVCVQSSSHPTTYLVACQWLVMRADRLFQVFCRCRGIVLGFRRRRAASLT